MPIALPQTFINTSRVVLTNLRNILRSSGLSKQGEMNDLHNLGNKLKDYLLFPFKNGVATDGFDFYVTQLEEAFKKSLNSLDDPSHIIQLRDLRDKLVPMIRELNHEIILSLHISDKIVESVIQKINKDLDSGNDPDAFHVFQIFHYLNARVQIGYKSSSKNFDAFIKVLERLTPDFSNSRLSIMLSRIEYIHDENITKLLYDSQNQDPIVMAWRKVHELMNNKFLNSG